MMSQILLHAEFGMQQNLQSVDCVTFVLILSFDSYCRVGQDDNGDSYTLEDMTVGSMQQKCWM